MLHIVLGCRNHQDLLRLSFDFSNLFFDASVVPHYNINTFDCASHSNYYRGASNSSRNDISLRDVRDYTEIPTQADRANEAYISTLTDNLNNCVFVMSIYDIQLPDLLTWNSILASLDSCMLQSSYRYCVSNGTVPVE